MRIDGYGPHVLDTDDVNLVLFLAPYLRRPTMYYFQP